MYKGRARYYKLVEEEIEIPDEIIEIHDDIYHRVPTDKIDVLQQFITDTWQKIEDKNDDDIDPSGIYVKEDGFEYVLAEY